MGNLTLTELFASQERLSLAEYMAWNNAQYYAQDTVLGKEGDFITSPELTPLFGYCLAQWVLNEMANLPPEASVLLVELGPGRGVLMRDILTVLKQAEKSAFVQPVLIETSPVLRQQQKSTLAEFIELSPIFIETLTDLDENDCRPMIVVCHEFFDALPIHQYLYQNSNWSERYVEKRGEFLLFVDQPCSEPLDYPLELQKKEDQVVEVPLLGLKIFSKLMERLSVQMGSCIVIDYGSWDVRHDTVQAVKAHKKVDPLSFPGTADLTAHVSFSRYVRQIPSSFQYAFTTQSRFLRQLGFETLLTLFSRCHRDSSPDQMKALTDIRQRLLGKGNEDMGELFKVLEVKNYERS